MTACSACPKGLFPLTLHLNWQIKFLKTIKRRQNLAKSACLKQCYGLYFFFLSSKDVRVKEQPNLIYFSAIWVWLEYKTVSTKPLVICQTDPLKLLHISHFLQTMKPPLGLKPTRKRLQSAILGVAV